MGQGDLQPRGKYYRKPIDPKKLKAMKEQWKRAPKIRKKQIQKKKKKDAPNAA